MLLSWRMYRIFSVVSFWYRNALFWKLTVLPLSGKSTKPALFGPLCGDNEDPLVLRQHVGWSSYRTLPMIMEADAVRELWGPDCSTAEDSSLVGLYTVPTRRVVPDVWKDNSAFLFRVYLPSFLNCLSLRMKALWSLKTLEITCPMTQHHIPGDRNLLIVS